MLGKLVEVDLTAVFMQPFRFFGAPYLHKLFDYGWLCFKGALAMLCDDLPQCNTTVCNVKRVED